MTDETKPLHTITILGGDVRQLTAADVLQRHGHTVVVTGFDTYEGIKSRSPEEALHGADTLLLPIPVIRNDRVNLPFSSLKLTVPALLQLLDTADHTLTAVFGGVLPPTLTEALAARGLRVIDLCEDERFNLLNAIPTAEGALAVAMEHLPITLHGASVAVLGFGRIGKTLCRLLQALGASVTAVARHEADLAYAECCGYRALSYRELAAAAGHLDLIFNTVPATVVTEDILTALPPAGRRIIDLASRPYGVDTDAALRHGVQVIHALSLPGKVAPATAGAIVAQCLERRLEEVRA